MKSDHLPAPTSQLPDIDPIVITLKGVVKLVQHLNPSKATGPDAIRPSALKELAVEITLYYNALSNEVLTPAHSFQNG